MFAEPILQKINDTQYNVSFGDDRSLFVEFYLEAIELEDESRIQGRPIYKEREFIRIMFPGDNTKEICRPVKMQADAHGPADPDRFPQQWRSFQNRQAQVQSGTPIEHWPPINKATALELKGINIHTVEQLAAVSDANLRMGMGQLRANARAWLEEAEAGAAVLKLSAENAMLKVEIEALKNQLAGLKTAVPNVVETEAEHAVDAMPEAKPIKTRMRRAKPDGENAAEPDTTGL